MSGCRQYFGCSSIKIEKGMLWSLSVGIQSRKRTIRSIRTQFTQYLLLGFDATFKLLCTLSIFPFARGLYAFVRVWWMPSNFVKFSIISSRNYDLLSGMSQKKPWNPINQGCINNRWCRNICQRIYFHSWRITVDHSQYVRIWDAFPMIPNLEAPNV